MEVADVAVAPGGATPDPEGLTAVDDPAGGVEAVGVGLVLGGLSEEDGKEGFAIKLPGFCSRDLKFSATKLRRRASPFTTCNTPICPAFCSCRIC